MRLESAFRFAVLMCYWEWDEGYEGDEIMNFVMGLKVLLRSVSVVGSRPVQYTYTRTIILSTLLVSELIFLQKCGACGL